MADHRLLPNVLCVGAWKPNSVFRFFCDALAQCGCRVVRVGPQLFGSFPNDELPCVFTFNMFDPNLSIGEGIAAAGITQPYSLRKVVFECRQRGFNPDLILVGPEGPVAVRDIPGVKVIDWKPIEPACDPYVHVWTNFAVRNGGCYKLDPNQIVSINVHVKLLNECSEVLIGPHNEQRRYQIEAESCGALGFDRWASVHCYDTYWHRAKSWLEEQGYEASLPRLVM